MNTWEEQNRCLQIDTEKRLYMRNIVLLYGDACPSPIRQVIKMHQEPEEIIHQICDVCSEEKPLSGFYKKETGKFGRSYTCKQCEIARVKRSRLEERAVLKERRYLKEYRAEYRRVEESGIISRARKDHHRRTRGRVSIADLTSGQWASILKNQRFRCNMCSKKFSETRKPTVDHITPVSKGGDLTLDNVQALCKSCNSRKHNKIMK